MNCKDSLLLIKFKETRTSLMSGTEKKNGFLNDFREHWLKVTK